MAFKQGKKPAVRVHRTELRRFRGALFKAGYQPHTGMRTQRNGEIQAWVKSIGRGRQVHVQEVLTRGEIVRVFAHTEPEGETLEHLAAALLDAVSYSGGSRVLRNDLRDVGWSE